MVERAVRSSRAVDIRRAWSLGLMGASGFAGLGYQIVWTQQGAAWLGHESAAVLAVLGAFFGGLAVGALALGSRIERSSQPLRWYAACEAVVAAWSLVLLVAMAPFSARMLAVIGPQPTAAWQWTVAFVGMFVVLLPATAAMGATLPAIERVVSSLGGRRSIAGHYAANTLGATAGVLCAAFWLVPALGLRGTTALCIALNACCAAGAWMLTPGRSAAPVGSAAATDAASRRRPMLLLAFTGLLGIGYEVLVVRVLSQVCEDTVYTFAMLLAVYLLGTAVGAAAYHRAIPRIHATDGVITDRLLSALASGCLLGATGLWFAEAVGAAARTALGDGLVASIGTEALLAAIAFAWPTLVMGALFSHLGAAAHRTGLSFGRSLGINIVGAAFAPLVFGVLLAPLLGAKVSLLLVVAGYLALTTRSAWARPVVWVPGALAALIAIGAPPLAFVDVPEGGRIVSYREGVLAAVSVVEDADGVARLRIDNRQQEGSSATRLVDGRQALLPLLLHPHPHRALFLGLGTGVTASTAADLPGVEVDAVELLPEVVAASALFRSSDAGADHSRLHLIQADARRYVRTSRTRYDVVVADNFHPARSGSGALYTVEHFAAIRERLADDGVFCQWLPLHQLDLDTLRSIVRSFQTAFPHGWAMLASNSLGTPVVGLVGSVSVRFDAVALRDRLLRDRDSAASFGIDDSMALLGGFIAGPAALRRFAADAPLNTDDRPVVAYRAPRFTYRPDSNAQDRLVTLLADLSIAPDELVDAAGAVDLRARLGRYWRARDLFIAAGRGVRPTADAHDMLAQVREPLLAILRVSADFRPAYDPLLRMAASLGQTDRDGARNLLRALMQVQPARPEAAALLQRFE